MLINFVMAIKKNILNIKLPSFELIMIRSTFNI